MTGLHVQVLLRRFFDAGDGAVVIERNDAQQQTVEYVITISLSLSLSFSCDRSSLERPTIREME